MTTATDVAFTMDQLDLVAEHYRERGYAIVRGVFAADEIAVAHAATDRIKARAQAIGRPWRQGNAHTVVGDDPAIGTTVRAAMWVSHLAPELEALRIDPRMLAICAPLIGTTLRQMTNQLHWKPPGSQVAINFHTDRVNRKPDGAFRHLGRSFVQSAIAIDPMTVDNGALLVIPGSHRAIEELIDTGGNYGSGDASRAILERRGYGEADLVAVHAAPGDVALWHPDTIHGSDVNRSQAMDRCIYINGYIDARATSRGQFAFIGGRPVPIPPLEVPVLLRHELDGVDQFPWQAESFWE